MGLSPDLLWFVALSCFAAYVQTVTGFAFGLLLMGAVALAHLMPLPDAAVIVGALSLSNAALVLARGWRALAMKPFLMTLLGGVPGIPVGYWVLERLADTSLSALRLVLGVVIVMSSLQLIRRPQPRPTVSGSGSFVFFGSIGGLMSGMFSTAGPPLVFHYFRQPLPVAAIRETLVAVFAVGATLRLGIVAGSGAWPTHALVWTAASLPGVVAATWLARRYPPPLSPAAMRRIAFGLLLLSGLSLALPAVIAV